ncbi:MAG: ATP-binding cassette domain-containing protein [Comamonadaceae bacterium]|nr:ATP-binding cassette domain-containing protein [Comamonadaceae bacterium]
MSGKVELHVPQVIFLADCSIAENIAFGVPIKQIDINRLTTAIRQSQLDEVVSALPQGILTNVGERGIQLSGGQRQRIGIARALYKDSDILLILDEATSALDTDTEAKVMAEIYSLKPELVIIMIAHRLSTLENCDEIYRLLDGKIQSSCI